MIDPCALPACDVPRMAATRTNATSACSRIIGCSCRRLIVTLSYESALKSRRGDEVTSEVDDHGLSLQTNVVSCGDREDGEVDRVGVTAAADRLERALNFIEHVPVSHQRLQIVLA